MKIIFKHSDSTSILMSNEPEVWKIIWIKKNMDERIALKISKNLKKTKRNQIVRNKKNKMVNRCFFSTEREKVLVINNVV